MNLMYQFTDIGYRFRQNKYNTQDFWYWPFTEITKFFTMVTFSISTVAVPPDEVEEATKLAEVWLRLDTNVMDHEKKVTSFT